MRPSRPDLLCREIGAYHHCETLIDLLCLRAEQQPDSLAYRFLLDGEQEETSIDYGELDRQARAIGAWLLENISEVGQPVLLLFQPGLDFISAFFGCLYGGMIAIPAYPPHPARRTRTSSRLQAIIENASPVATLTTSDLLLAAEKELGGHKEGMNSPLLAIDSICETDALTAVDSFVQSLAQRWIRPPIDADSLVMLQYTSGSTGLPQGVMLSHGNLLHNSEQIRIYFEHTRESRCLSWLPPYHDMGLIGGILQPLYAGFPSTLLSPMHFLQQPVRWFHAITRWQITSSGGPNFAYDLCVEKITAEQRAELDLSSWTVAWNGAEPVRSETLDRFTAAFAPHGFRREAFYPCYGLAEATLMVSGGCKVERPVIAPLQRERLASGEVVLAEEDGPATHSLVGCGRSIPEQEIAIVDPQRCTRCPPARVGEIWVRGPSVAQGYWRSDEQTTHTFGAFLADDGEGPFLRTGDLGFLREGELFITGRLKDLIILNGCNHYPQDIERSVEQCHPAIQSNCCVAFSVDQDSEERLIILAEVKRAYWSGAARQTGKPAPSNCSPSNEWEPVFKAIRSAVSQQHNARVTQVLLVRPASLPKTPSGKHQRRACREAFLRGGLQDLCVVDR